MLPDINHQKLGAWIAGVTVAACAFFTAASLLHGEIAPIQQGVAAVSGGGTMTILVLGSGYNGNTATFQSDIERYKTELFSIEPFKSRSSQISIVSGGLSDFNCKLETFSQGYAEVRELWQCDSNLIQTTANASGVSYDKVMVVINSPGQPGGGYATASDVPCCGVLANSSPLYEAVFTHELGHLMGLADQYVALPGNGQITNTVFFGNCHRSSYPSVPAEWQNIVWPGEMQQGCDYRNWYRPQYISIMKDATIWYFDAPSTALINNRLDGFAGSVSAATMRQTNTGTFWLSGSAQVYYEPSAPFGNGGRDSATANSTLPDVTVTLGYRERGSSDAFKNASFLMPGARGLILGGGRVDNLPIGDYEVRLVGTTLPPDYTVVASTLWCSGIPVPSGNDISIVMITAGDVWPNAYDSCTLKLYVRPPATESSGGGETEPPSGGSTGESGGETGTVPVHPICTPDFVNQCIGSQIYSFDSCNNLGKLVKQCAANQICSNGACSDIVCTPNAGKKCIPGGYIGSIDSCGNLTGVVGQCVGQEICSNGECVSKSCSANTDCGSSGYVGATTCSGIFQVMQVYTDYACQNPGTNQSSCKVNNFAKTKEICVNGQICSSGRCVNGPVISAKPEAVDTSACRVNQDCGKDGFTGDMFCNSGKLYQTYASYTCLNAGTAVAHCAKSTQAKLKESCVTGACDGNACKGAISKPEINSQPVEIPVEPQKPCVPGCKSGFTCSNGICKEGLAPKQPTVSQPEAPVVGACDPECPYGFACNNSKCIAQIACIPQCDGRSCGSDGCGGSCGSCQSNATCMEGFCIRCDQELQVQCSGNSAYQFDLCGNQGDLVQECSQGTLCAADGVSASCQAIPQTGGFFQRIADAVVGFFRKLLIGQ